MTQTAELSGFLRLPEVLELIPISRAGWWAGVKEGRYPKPVKIGPRTTAWRVADIQKFIENPESFQAEKQPA